MEIAYVNNGTRKRYRFFLATKDLHEDPRVLYEKGVIKRKKFE